MFVSPDDSAKAVDIIQSADSDFAPCIIGSVMGDNPGIITLKTKIGTERIVDMLSGEQLPRIC